MAYNFIPKSISELNLLGQSKIVNDLILAYNYVIIKVPSVKSNGPFSIDKNKPSSVKVYRQLNGVISLQELKRIAPSINFAWGNGSRGNQGAGNRGNLFEVEFMQDIHKYIADELDPTIKNKTLVKDLFNYYKLNDKTNIIIVKGMGELNQRRPLTFIGNKPRIGSNASNNIGSKVSDVDLIVGNKTIHFSLKFGPKVTFFNSGITKILPQSEIKSGLIKNPDGLKLLSMFGINNALFCDVFNSYGTVSRSPHIEDTLRYIDKSILTDFIKSGMGYGYHMVHKQSQYTHSYEMTQLKLNKAAIPTSCKVKYPGGNAKRIDITVETDSYILLFNIRSKTGATYPTHIMCDYQFKK